MGDSIEELKKAVENLHRCRAHFIESLVVKEKFQDKTVWEGIVFVFDLQKHSTATKAYAWSSPIEGSSKRRFFAVLHQGPVKSAQDAVRAAIVGEFRKNPLGRRKDESKNFYRFLELTTILE